MAGASSIGRITFLETNKITYFKMLKNYRVRIAVMVGTVGVIFMFFYESILTEHLVNIGIGKSETGYFFGLVSFVYTLSSLLIGYLCHFIKRRYLTQFSLLLSALALFCLGPSKLLNFPETSYSLTIIGISILGLSAAGIFVPLLSEIIEAMQLEAIIGDNCPELTDKASGLFNAAYASGCIAAPLIGAALNEKWGFSTTCDVLALSALLCSAIYFAVGVFPEWCKKDDQKITIIE